MRTWTAAWILGLAAALAACADDEGTGASAGAGGGPGGAGGSGAGTTAGGGGSGGGDAAPTTVFLATPLPGQTNGVPSAFELDCDDDTDDDCTFECSLDGAAFAPCDATFALAPLAPSPHSLAVRATDAAGNVELVPKVHDWTLTAGYLRVAATESAACAISTTGTLHCWGRDDDGLVGDGPVDLGPTATPRAVGEDTDWEDVFAGRESFCARRADGLYCWGYEYALGDEDAQDPTTEPLPYSDTLISLHAGYDAACGLDAAGTLHCVGWGGDGLLADGDDQPHYAATPTAVGAETYTQVAMGSQHACAIRSDGQLLCWGRQPVTETVLSEPTALGGSETWSRVSVGDDHACAVTETGEFHCWGYNGSGQLGLGDFDDVTTPTQVGEETDWVDVVAADDGTCALKGDGRGYCWGSNARGQLGSLTAPLTITAAPTLIDAEVGLRTLTGLAQTRCALTDLGDARCWGPNDDGVLGRGVLPNQPTMVLIDDVFDRLATTDAGGCGLASGALLCWGRGRPNGEPNGLPRPTPTPVTSDADWTDVTISPFSDGHACGIRAGALYCWGNNDAGQLGTGNTTPALAPTEVVAVPGVTGWAHVSAGTRATCAVATSGDLYCWGLNQYGQLGLGNSVDQLLPSKVALSGVASVEMGFYRVGARGMDGTFHNWGVNATMSPTAIPGTDWAVVDTTGFGECGVKMNGTLHCTFQGVPGAFQAGSATDWIGVVGPGYPYCALNSQGVVGCFVNNGNNDGFAVSPAIEATAGWTQLVNTGGAACGLRNGTERHCRGYRELGSLGDGFDERVPTPVLAP